MFSFLAPIFLWALSAALVPLILHMMQRRRIITIPFSTVRFLKLAQKKSANRIRMENILLWLLRTLLMIFIALAFAAPVFRTSSFSNLLSTSRRDISIVWDASYSMGYVSGQKNVWDESQNAVCAIIESLRSGDRVSLFLADDSGTALVEQPSSDRKMVLDIAKAQKPRNSASQILPALQAAYDSLAGSDRSEKEIFIISDGQNLPWSDFRKARGAGESTEGKPARPPAALEAQLPRAGNATNSIAGGPVQNATNAAVETTETEDEEIPSIPSANESQTNTFPKAVKKTPDRKNIPVFAGILGVVAPENSAPLALEIQPSTLMANMPAQLQVKIGHTGSAHNDSVALFIDNKEICRRSVIMQADARNNIVFPIPELPAGNYTARIETAPDGLEIDNSFFLLLNVRNTLPVLCVGTENDSFFLMKALNPSGNPAAIAVRRIEPQAVGAEQKLADYSAIFLCNAVPLAGEALMPLEQYVQKGGVLALFPGDRGAPGDYASWGCLPALPQKVEELRGTDIRQMLRLVKPGDALFRGMKLPPGAVPTIAANRMLAWGKPAPKSEIVVDSDRGKPFLLRRNYGKGHVLCFSVSADRRWSNLPLSAFFLPIVHQIVRFGSDLKSASPFFWSARNLIISDFAGVNPDSGEITDPAGNSIPIARIKSADNAVISVVKDASGPGIYRIKGAGKENTEAPPLFAINVPRAESDLTRIDPDEIPKLLGGGKVYLAQNQENLLRLISEHRMGRPVAEQLLWAAFLIGIMEFLLANRASRKATTLSQQLHIESSGRVKGKAS